LPDKLRPTDGRAGDETGDGVERRRKGDESVEGTGREWRDRSSFPDGKLWRIEVGRQRKIVLQVVGNMTCYILWRLKGWGRMEDEKEKAQIWRRTTRNALLRAGRTYRQREEDRSGVGADVLEYAADLLSCERARRQVGAETAFDGQGCVR
jgi:hypothetical protein